MKHILVTLLLNILPIVLIIALTIFKVSTLVLIAIVVDIMERLLLVGMGQL